jgi:expansin (peptidoglycan-binding protein)
VRWFLRCIVRNSAMALVVLVWNIAAEVDDGSVVHQGEATFYGEGALGHCGFPVETQPQFHGAMNHTDYDTAAACGAWVHIWGPKGEVTAFIDDECPECKPGDIDLGPNTFTKIGDPAAGRIPIKWCYVPMASANPVRYHWQAGSSQWHIAVQVLNHSRGITKLEMKTMTSDWVLIPRQVYNYFVLPGGIDSAPGPYSVRITDILGNQLIDSDVTISQNQTQDGAANFPAHIKFGTGNRALDAARGSGRPIISVFLGSGAVLPAGTRSTTADVYSINGKKIGTFVAHQGAFRIPPESAVRGSAVICIVPH